MKRFDRIFLIVLDSVGIGAAKDAAVYNDENSNTFKHISESVDEFDVPNLEGLGIGLLGDFKNVNKVHKPLAYLTRLEEESVGKDTMTGHWEMMGLKITNPFQTFTDTGFPKELITELEAKTGRKIVGNYSESGTKILDDWGEHHMSTGDLIVYTSADSVLQIAAHEDIIPVEELYNICNIARDITMKPEWKVGRIIARPFIGPCKGQFKRTSNRHDLALKPFGKTVLNSLQESNFDVIGLGKIYDIFDGEGITRSIKTVSNDDGMNKITDLAKENFSGLAFLNLVDFDAIYGHRRDPIGYAKSLEVFDKQLLDFMYQMKCNDLLMITADHGNDPTYKGTDHTREDVPLIIYSKSITLPVLLDSQQSFATIGATIAENFNVNNPGIGKSILDLIK